MQLDITDIQSLCAAGAIIHEEHISINDSVNLKIFDITPAQKTDLPTVVFVAGWISRIEGWADVLCEMSKDFPIKYIETRDKISSQLKKGAQLRVEDIGDDIVKLVKRWNLKEKNYILLGSSLGATAILDSAEKYSPTPKAMILVAPNTEFRMPLIWQWIIGGFWPHLYFIIRPLIKWYLKHFRMHVDADIAQYKKYCTALDAADPNKLKTAAKTLWHYSVWDKLKCINIPVFIFSASTDKLHEPEQVERMLSLLPQAEHLDMKTNSATHSAEMVIALRQYLETIG
ncbi:alpha/beta hydrolase [bacterium]|nr:alpha/beta hydrolase [bacterium]